MHLEPSSLLPHVFVFLSLVLIQLGNKERKFKKAELTEEAHFSDRRLQEFMDNKYSSSDLLESLLTGELVSHPFKSTCHQPG